MGKLIKMIGKLNCWEYKHCERGPAHDDYEKKDLCPAATSVVHNGINNGVNAGRFCWKVAGTFSTMNFQGSFTKKIMLR